MVLTKHRLCIPHDGPMQFLSAENSEQVRLQLDKEFLCLHKRAALTLQLRKGDKKFYRTQCLECGHIVQELRRADLSEDEIRSAIPYDDSLTQQFYKRRNERYTELQQQQLRIQRYEFNERYANYLASDEWNEIRTKVLKRDKFLCQGCGVNRAVDVHHLTYERIYCEMLFDLIAVCRECHLRLHPEHDED